MPASKLESLLGAVADEVLELASRGETPDVDEYVARYPEAEATLRQLFRAIFSLQLPAAEQVSSRLPTGLDNPGVGRLGDFLILRPVGEGGMGTVYEARDVRLRRRVALKVIRGAAGQNPRTRARFENEVTAAAVLKHPHIVPIYSVGEENQALYYAMQFVEGCSWRDLLVQLQQRRLVAQLRGPGAAISGSETEASTVRAAIVPPTTEPTAGAVQPAPLPGSLQTSSAGWANVAAPEPGSLADKVHLPTTWQDDGLEIERIRQVVQWGALIAQALEHAHGQGILHRDIKPSNLLLDRHGNPWITDFGLAKVAATPELTETGEMIGTLRYMSPEQAAGRTSQMDERTDIYSLGVTLYEMLTLGPAIPGEDRAEILEQIERGRIVSPRRRNRTIPRDLERVLLKSMSREPEQRYRSAGELAADLQRFLQQLPVTATAPTMTYRAGKFLQRHQRLVWGATASLCLLLLVSAGWLGSLMVAMKETLNAQRVATQAVESLQWRQYLSETQSAGRELQRQDLVSVSSRIDSFWPSPQHPDVRGFEWYWLDRLSHVPQNGVSLDTKPLYAMACSPDGQHLAAGGASGTIYIVDSLTGLERHRFDSKQGVVNRLSYSVDGRMLASAGGDGTVKLWDWAERRAARSIQAHRGACHAVQFTPVGSLLVSCGRESSVHVWDPDDGTRLHTFPTGWETVHTLAVSSDGQRLAVCGSGREIILWSLESQDEVARLAPLPDVPHALAFIADRSQLVSAGSDGRVRIWDLESGQFQEALHCEQAVHTVASQGPGQPIFVGTQGGTLHGFTSPLPGANTAPILPWRGHDGMIRALQPFPNRPGIATVGEDGWLRIWPEGSSPAARCLVPQGAVDFAWLASDQLAVVEAGGISVFSARVDQPVGLPLFAVAGDARLGRPDAVPSGIAATADGQTLFLSYREDDGHCTLEIWDIALKQLQQRLSIGRKETIRAVAADGTWAAVHLNDSQLTVLDTRTGASLYWSKLSATDACCLNANGTRLALATAAGIEIVNTSTWSVDQLLLSNPPRTVQGMAFSPDGKLLATHTADQSLQLWKLDSPRTPPPRIVPLGNGRHVAFSEDGRTLALGGTPDLRDGDSSADLSLQLWNVHTGESLFVIDKSPTGYRRVAFSPEGRYLACLTDGGRLMIYDGGKPSASERSGSLPQLPEEALPEANAFAESLGPNPPDVVQDQFAEFGSPLWAISVGARLLAVGAPTASIDQQPEAGRVVVLDAATGAKQFELRPPADESSAHFGVAVAIAEGHIAAGAPGAGAGQAGGVGVFSKASGRLLEWISHPQPNPGDAFGTSLALTDKYLVVGCPRWSDGATRCGAVAVYSRGTAYQFLRLIPNPDPNPESGFGTSVTTFVDRGDSYFIVGAPYADLGDVDAGMVGVFSAETGELLRVLAHPRPGRGAHFGSSLATCEDRLVIGAPGTSGSSGQGAVYVIDPLSGSCGHVLLPPESGPVGSRFGHSVTGDGSLILVGQLPHSSVRSSPATRFTFDTHSGRLLDAWKISPASTGSTTETLQVGLSKRRQFASVGNGLHWQERPASTRTDPEVRSTIVHRRVATAREQHPANQTLRHLRIVRLTFHPQQLDLLPLPTYLVRYAGRDQQFQTGDDLVLAPVAHPVGDDLMLEWPALDQGACQIESADGEVVARNL